MRTEEQEREAFEAWIRDVYFDGCDDAGPWNETRNCYDRLDTHMAWKGWTAALAARAESAGEAEPVAWRDVQDSPEYEVSSNGDVRRKDSGKILAKPLAGKGYQKADLYSGGIRRQTTVHRLVAEAFVEGEGNEVNHKNGIKTDNRACNLEWATRSENEIHSRYELGNLVKPVVSTDPATGETKEYPSVESVVRSGFHSSSVYKCCYGRQPLHKGLKWEFVNPAHADGKLLSRPAAQPAPEWQPIETAPKDGSGVVLGFNDDEMGGFVGQGRWHDEDHDGPDNMGHDAGFMDDQFDFFKCARSIGNPAYQHKGLQPTHWMPLPPAPGAAQPAPVGSALTDAAILHRWDTHVGTPDEKRPLTDDDKISFARACIALAAAHAQADPHPPWCSGGCCETVDRMEKHMVRKSIPSDESDLKEPKNQTEWDQVYALNRYWADRAHKAETALAAASAPASADDVALNDAYAEGRKDESEAWMAATGWDSPAPTCKRCGGGGWVMAGHGESAGADECPVCSEPLAPAEAVKGVSTAEPAWTYDKNGSGKWEPAVAVQAEPKDWPLPCDVTIEGVTFNKGGCTLQTVIDQTGHMLRAYERAAKLAHPEPAAPATADEAVSVEAIRRLFVEHGHLYAGWLELARDILALRSGASDLGRTAPVAPSDEAIEYGTKDPMLSSLQADLQIMMASAVAEGGEFVTGYRIKTGAIHRIIGDMQAAGYPVTLPNLSGASTAAGGDAS